MSSNLPYLWIVAGPNGAGKTTLAQIPRIAAKLASAERLNPDDLSKVLLQQRGGFTFQTASAEMLQATFIEAAESVFQEAQIALTNNRSICLETVLSTPKYRSLVELTLNRGGFFGFFYIAVKSPEISAIRIANRVAEGGHGVPTDKLAARWERSLAQLPWFVKRAHYMLAYDNSAEVKGTPPELIAIKNASGLQIKRPDLIPELTHALQQSLSS
ncbi:Zeta toxin [Anatilimnocola aggregata]|uniref:Zeta toxin n=1 Tax=Anatilimnocola aggregata TaxID=2528021 RepID=A0A517Y847_9BACT|nr:AAA family ATPase [Anatilimnocola aggregata]QDU26419.1 Zeta toxin [Anatilimnocola aggregata]